MDVEAAQVFTSLLALIALAGAVLIVVARMLSRRAAWAAEIVEMLRGPALWLAWLVAAAATAGSLYFSEVAHYVPCKLCWYQRIATYPLAVVLLVAALRRDRGVKWYVVPVAAIGAAISSYHYLIEWRPSLGEDSCSFGPSCTDIWFRSLGFVTLAFMALCAFLAVITLTTLPTARAAGPSAAATSTDEET